VGGRAGSARLFHFVGDHHPGLNVALVPSSAGATVKSSSLGIENQELGRFASVNPPVAPDLYVLSVLPKHEDPSGVRAGSNAAVVRRQGFFRSTHFWDTTPAHLWSVVPSVLPAHSGRIIGLQRCGASPGWPDFPGLGVSRPVDVRRNGRWTSHVRMLALAAWGRYDSTARRGSGSDCL